MHNDNDHASGKHDNVLLKAYQQAIDVNIISSITDTKGIITYVNRKFCEVSKYSRSELVGKNHRIINSNHHPKEFFVQMWKTILSGEVWHGEIRNRAKDGSTYWVETVIIPIRESSGTITSYLSLRLLITDRKNAEAERAEYTLRLREILEMTSHRVRAPLATCMGLMNMLKQHPHPNAEEERTLIAHLQQSAQQLNLFTHELTGLLTSLESRYGGVLPVQRKNNAESCGENHAD